MRYTTLLIDLDETIYPSSAGVWDAISVRMEEYMHLRLGFDLQEIPRIRQDLFHQYGTTLRGLQMTRHIDEHEFIDYVHDVPINQMLQPDPDLREMLSHYPQRKLIFTNADKKHAGRVLQQMELASCFDGIIDIYDVSPYCKPMPEAYQTALRLSGETAPERCVFIDDSPRNLAGARLAGMFTIQVGQPKSGFNHPETQADRRINRLIDLPQALEP